MKSLVCILYYTPLLKQLNSYFITYYSTQVNLKEKAGLATGSGCGIGPSTTLVLAEAEAVRHFFKKPNIFKHLVAKPKYICHNTVLL